MYQKMHMVSASLLAHISFFLQWSSLEKVSMSNLVFFSTKPFCRELYWICVSRMWRSPMYIPTSGSHSMRVASPERSHTRPKAGDDAACAKDYSCLIIQSTQTITLSSLFLKLYKSEIILFFVETLISYSAGQCTAWCFFWANERSNFHLPFGPTKKGVPFDCIDYSIFIKASDMMSQFLKHHSPLKIYQSLSDLNFRDAREHSVTQKIWHMSNFCAIWCLARWICWSPVGTLTILVRD